MTLEEFRGGSPGKREKGDFESPRIMNPSPSADEARVELDGRKSSGEIDRQTFFSDS